MQSPEQPPPVDAPSSAPAAHGFAPAWEISGGNQPPILHCPPHPPLTSSTTHSTRDQQHDPNLRRLMGRVPTALAVAHGVCMSYVPSPCSCRARLRFRHGSPLPPQTPSLGPKSCLGNQFSIARAHSGAWLRYEIHASRQTDRPDHPPTRDRGESPGLWSCLVAAADPCCAPQKASLCSLTHRFCQPRSEAEWECQEETC